MGGLRLLKGALAGCIATGPMTVAMLLMHRFLPGEQRYALPPALITRRLTGGKGPFARLGSHENKALTYLMHFGFGTTFGAVYALVPRQFPLPPVLRGVLFALGVWAGSYLGWIPAAQILPPATKHPVERNALMIIAHVIWGAAVGGLLAALDPDDAPQPEHPTTPMEEGNPHAATARPAGPARAAEPERGPAEAATTAPAPGPPPGDRVGDDAASGSGGPELPGEPQTPE
jgi:xanthosine utilization system XapX-like protein